MELSCYTKYGLLGSAHLVENKEDVKENSKAIDGYDLPQEAGLAGSTHAFDFGHDVKALSQGGHRALLPQPLVLWHGKTMHHRGVVTWSDWRRVKGYTHTHTHTHTRHNYTLYTATSYCNSVVDDDLSCILLSFSPDGNIKTVFYMQNVAKWKLNRSKTS